MKIVVATTIPVAVCLIVVLTVVVFLLVRAKKDSFYNNNVELQANENAENLAGFSESHGFNILIG